MTDLPESPDPLFLSFQLALAGRYSIDRELGRGGMGVVYLAREVHLDRLVAIKLLPPALAERPGLRDRFLREAQLAAKLSHPNIIPIHSVGETGGFVYFVMAFVDGETLTQRVQARGPLSASDGIRLLREVAWALGYAHGHGLVHRDVKPDNILIEHGTGRAMVADFGIAAATGDAIAAGVSGTPEFMSPEQAVGGEVDARSDLYSLGVTAFFALSGRLPFQGGTAAGVLARQVSESAPSLRAAASGAPRRLAQLVDRCLAKDPAHRPASAQEVADQLGVAIDQRRELPAALRAFVKRNGRMDGGGTLLALGTVVVASVATAKIVGLAAASLVCVGGVATVAATFAVTAAKRLLDQGFTQADIVPAFRAELESSREERGGQVGAARRTVERVLRVASRVSLSTSAVLLAIAAIPMDPSPMAYAPPFAVGLLAALGLATGIVTGAGYLALLQMRRDVDVEFWSAAWTGRAGRWAFAMARRWRGTAPIAAAMTHRATELSLGMAAEQLFETLPRSSRDALGDVPAVLRRLQEDAQRLRARQGRVQELLHQLSEASDGDECAAVQAECEVVRERLRETVGAMETMRLNLLRLHAGALSLEAFTTHLDLAAAVSDDVERLIAAQGEVDALLRLPRSIELTPVGGD
jgi:serine/threonine-protein kinase